MLIRMYLAVCVLLLIEFNYVTESKSLDQVRDRIQVNEQTYFSNPIEVKDRNQPVDYIQLSNKFTQSNGQSNGQSPNQSVSSIQPNSFVQSNSLIACNNRTTTTQINNQSPPNAIQLNDKLIAIRNDVQLNERGWIGSEKDSNRTSNQSAMHISEIDNKISNTISDQPSNGTRAISDELSVRTFNATPRQVAWNLIKNQQSDSSPRAKPFNAISFQNLTNTGHNSKHLKANAPKSKFNRTRNQPINAGDLYQEIIQRNRSTITTSSTTTTTTTVSPLPFSLPGREPPFIPQRILNQTDLEMFKLIQKNHTLALVHRLINKFNNFTENRMKLLRKNQSRLIQRLGNHINNNYPNYQTLFKFNQTKLRQLFEIEKQVDKTVDHSSLDDRLNGNEQSILEELVPITDQQTSEQKNARYVSPSNSKSTNQLIGSRTNDRAIKNEHTPSANESRSASSIGKNNSLGIDCSTCLKANSDLRPDCDRCNNKTIEVPSIDRTQSAATAPTATRPPGREQRLTLINQLKKTTNHSEHSSVVSSALDVNYRPNNGEKNLNFKSILKKSRLIAPRSPGSQSNQYAQQNMPPTNPSQPQQPANYPPNPNALTTTIPTCTLLDMFCWFYRYTRFMFVYTY